MPTASSVLSRLSIGVASAVGLYALLLGILLTPNNQRLYVCSPVVAGRI